MPTVFRNVRSWGAGKHMLASSFSGLDPKRTLREFVSRTIFPWEAVEPSMVATWELRIAWKFVPVPGRRLLGQIENPAIGCGYAGAEGNDHRAVYQRVRSRDFAGIGHGAEARPPVDDSSIPYQCICAA